MFLAALKRAFFKKVVKWQSSSKEVFVDGFRNGQNTRRAPARVKNVTGLNEIFRSWTTASECHVVCSQTRVDTNTFNVEDLVNMLPSLRFKRCSKQSHEAVSTANQLVCQGCHNSSDLHLVEACWGHRGLENLSGEGVKVMRAKIGDPFDCRLKSEGCSLGMKYFTLEAYACQVISIMSEVFDKFWTAFRYLDSVDTVLQIHDD